MTVAEEDELCLRMKSQDGSILKGLFQPFFISFFHVIFPFDRIFYTFFCACHYGADAGKQRAGDSTDREGVRDSAQKIRLPIDKAYIVFCFEIVENTATIAETEKVCRKGIPER